MKLFHNINDIEAGLDECARGTLFGRIYAAAVIWPTYKYIDDPYIDKIIDSKKLTRDQRESLIEYIENMAIDFHISWIEPDIIDKINILEANMKVFHQCIDGLRIKPTKLLVDGNRFKFYGNNNNATPHVCVVKGDNKYISIAAASILAKVYHDRYILDLCNRYPTLKEYDLENNMGYGTKKHLDAIKKLELTPYHRKTFGICQNYT